MPTNYKVLGQSSPSSQTYTELYQVPAGKEAVLSTITVCNATASATSYRLGITASATAASAIALSEIIAFNATVPANDTSALTLGITLNDRRKLIGYGNSASVVFGVFGSEIS